MSSKVKPASGFDYQLFLEKKNHNDKIKRIKSA